MSVCIVCAPAPVSTYNRPPRPMHVENAVLSALQPLCPATLLTLSLSHSFTHPLTLSLSHSLTFIFSLSFSHSLILSFSHSRRFGFGVSGPPSPRPSQAQPEPSERPSHRPSKRPSQRPSQSPSPQRPHPHDGVSRWPHPARAQPEAQPSPSGAKAEGQKWEVERPRKGRSGR